MRPLLYLLFFVHTPVILRANSLIGHPLINVRLIMGIRDRCGASSIFFLHPGDEYGDDGDLGTTYIVHTWTRYFGQRGILTLNISFKIGLVLNKYVNRIVKPLVIVFISGPRAFSEFSKLTKSFKMSYVTWVVLFLSNPKNGTHDDCHEPVGNPFNVAFDTEMLVLCFDDPVIREWYSVRGEGTIVSDVAIWDADAESVIRTTNLSLYERRKNLNGITLRGVTIEHSAICNIEKGELTGFFGLILHELMSCMNFSLEITASSIDYGTYDRTNKMFNGAVGIVASRQADIALSGFSMTPERIEQVDYLIPLILSKDHLYIVQPEMFAVQWYAFFRTFSYGIWLAIFVIAIGCLIVLIIIKLAVCPKSLLYLIYDDFFNIWRILCQQGLMEFPENTSLRIVYLSLFCTVFIIFAAYSASLICFLTTRVRVLPFTSLEGFIQDGSYSLILTQDSAEHDMFTNSKNSLAVDMIQLLKPPYSLPRSYLDGFNQICKDPKLVFYATSAIKQALSPHLSCKISSINAGRVDCLSMILSKDNPYTAVLNYHLRRFLNNGVLDRARAASDTKYFDNEMTFQPVQFFSIASVVAIFAGGIVLATLVLAVEIYYIKRKYNVKSIASIIKRNTLHIPHMG